MLDETGDESPDHIAALLRHRSEHSVVQGFPGTQPLTNDELLTLECDVLIPAALEGQLHEGNADRIRAKLIVEGTAMMSLRGTATSPAVFSPK